MYIRSPNQTRFGISLSASVWSLFPVCAYEFGVKYCSSSLNRTVLRPGAPLRPALSRPGPLRVSVRWFTGPTEALLAGQHALIVGGPLSDGVIALCLCGWTVGDCPSWVWSSAEGRMGRVLRSVSFNHSSLELQRNVTQLCQNANVLTLWLLVLI